MASLHILEKFNFKNNQSTTYCTFYLFLPLLIYYFFFRFGRAAALDGTVLTRGRSLVGSLQTSQRYANYTPTKSIKKEQKYSQIMQTTVYRCAVHFRKVPTPNSSKKSINKHFNSSTQFFQNRTCLGTYHRPYLSIAKKFIDRFSGKNLGRSCPGVNGAAVAVPHRKDVTFCYA